MKFFQNMERKFGKYAISNLMLYITILYAAGLLFYVFSPVSYLTTYYEYLALRGDALLHGQIWRLLTFLIYPPAFGSFNFTQIFFGVIALFMYYSLGRTLEQVWGSFRFNVFVIMGIIGQAVACLTGYLVFNQIWIMTTGFINLSIFLVFCLAFPNTTFMLFMIIPVKASWLAVADGCVYLYSFITGNSATRCQILISLAAVLLFFFISRRAPLPSAKQIKVRRDFKKQTKMVPETQARHRCAVCGRTEKDGADLEFRYCSKCQGNYEYCQDHLYTHRHVTSDDQGGSRPDNITQISQGDKRSQ